MRFFPFPPRGFCAGTFFLGPCRRGHLFPFFQAKGALVFCPRGVQPGIGAGAFFVDFPFSLFWQLGGAPHPPRCSTAFYAGRRKRAKGKGERRGPPQIRDFPTVLVVLGRVGCFFFGQFDPLGVLRRFPFPPPAHHSHRQTGFLPRSRPLGGTALPFFFFFPQGRIGGPSPTFFFPGGR